MLDVPKLRVSVQSMKDQAYLIIFGRHRTKRFNLVIDLPLGLVLLSIKQVRVI